MLNQQFANNNIVQFGSSFGYKFFNFGQVYSTNLRWDHLCLKQD